MIKVRNAEKTRKTILAAAEIEFSEMGLHGARVDQIASRSDINKRMIYEYYGSKEGLYKSVLAEVYSRIGKYEEALLAEDLPADEMIRKVLAFYFAYLRNNPTYVNLLLWENLNQGRYIKDVDLSELRFDAFDRLRKVINKGKHSGIFRLEIDVEQTIFSLLTFTFSYFSNQYTMSKLIGLDLHDEAVEKERLKYVTDMFMIYLSVK